MSIQNALVAVAFPIFSWISWLLGGIDHFLRSSVDVTILIGALWIIWNMLKTFTTRIEGRLEGLAKSIEENYQRLLYVSAQIDHLKDHIDYKVGND